MNKREAEIAQEFVSLHKNANLGDWQPLHEFRKGRKLEVIYRNLVDDVYGEVRTNGNEAEVEISAHQSASGRPVLFIFKTLEV